MSKICTAFEILGSRMCVHVIQWEVLALITILCYRITNH